MSNYLPLLGLVIPALAAAELRVDAHLAGGIEAGTISGEDHPCGVTELGLGVAVLGKEAGIGVVIERVGRSAANLPRDSELKLDALALLRVKDRFVFGFGAGLRRLEVGDATDRRGSTLWGVDLIRYQFTARILRVGPVAIETYFAWSFGFYRGEVYGARTGDMPYPVRDYGSIATSYVLGLGTAYVTRP